jgi:hypothetical protein
VLQAQYSTRPALLGETGWWTQGQDGGYQASTRVGTLADAKAYYQGLYPHLTSCSVPTLIFEAFEATHRRPLRPAAHRLDATAFARGRQRMLGAIFLSDQKTKAPTRERATQSGL